MPQHALIDRAIDGIADGMPLDWDALDSQAPDDERELLKCLRILGGIADLHRSTVDDPSVEMPAPLRAVTARAMTSEDPLESWGRYSLVEKIGEGSFGSVYRAWDPELEREIAIKILHSRVSDAYLRDQLLREGRALARVRHPNVVSVLGMEAHGDRVGLCMEFVRGETLESVLTTQGTLNAREAVLIGEEVSRALAAVHAAGFVHRDIKARNVMRERAGRIVLMDFGTGRAADELKESGRVGMAGTPLYMAPEVLAGLPASASSDVYSVGVLQYHLVTSDYPVEGRSIEELRAAHMQGRRVLLSERRADLPMPFIQVIDRALAPDPARRYSSAGALLEALGQISLPAPRLSVAQYLLRAGLAAAGTAAAMTGLGVLSSLQFNTALGRSGFVAETAVDWLIWGARSTVALAVLFLIALAAVALLIVSRTVLVAISETVRTAESGLRARLHRVVQRWHLVDVSVLASCVLLMSTMALLAVWWGFWPLINALIQRVSTAPADDLSLLAPDYLLYHTNFMKALMWLVIVSVFAWYLVWRLASARREAINKGLLAGGLAVVLLGLVLHDFPYRMLYHNQFDAVTWNGSDCYVLGERPGASLLFCPELAPRNREVSNGASLVRTGVKESIFKRFYKGSGPSGPNGR